MRLKRLELFGFKSFADRMVLNFERSVTGIVGPNGCGKSNVVDAIRWVLGEQRAKSMRGGEMTDVIFKGSASRAAMSVAEVTMVLDNSDETIEERGDEIAITRRVYRSGEGEYLIDGDRMRLKDVREMLFGTGLGSRGYSVLEQGRIDAVLSANAQERRAIFEEAAGVSRYRQRKKEAESRLRRVDADCLRLDDVLGELERRERSLKIQAGKAQRFVEARDSWRIDGMRLAQHQSHDLAVSLGEIGRELTGMERQVEEQRELRAAAESDVSTRELEQQTLGAEVQRAAQESAEMGAELRALDERRGQLTARVQAWRASSSEERGRAAHLQERLSQRESESNELDAVRTGLESEATEARSGADALTERARDLRDQQRQSRADSEAKNKQVLGILQERTGLRNRVQSLTERQAPLAERGERSDATRLEASKRCEDAQSHEERAARELTRLEGELETLDAERAVVLAARNLLEEQLREAKARHKELELDVTRLGSRVESLLDWEREREGLESGAQAVLEGSEADDFPRLSGQLAGLVADQLRVDTRLARALDVVLGGRAQALVVNSPADARSLVEWLREGERGRVRLASPAGVVEVAPQELPSDLVSRTGVEGLLLTQTHIAEGFANLAQALLAGVVLVESLALALELVQAHPTLRFVTPEGDLVDAAGVSGGHIDVSQGAVGRRSFAAELDDRRAAIAAEMETLDIQVSEQAAALAECVAKTEELRRRAEQLGQERGRARGIVESVKRRVADLQRALEVAETECGNLVRERESIDADLVTASERLTLVEADFEQENAALQEIEHARLEGETAVEAVGREESSARVGATSLEERLRATRRRCSDLNATIEEARLEAERSSRLADEHDKAADDGDTEGERLVGQHGEMLQERGQLEERLTELRERDRSGREAIDSLRKRGEAVTVSLEGLLDSVSQGRLKQQKLELADDELGRRVQEDFSLERHQLLEDFEPEEELADPKTMRELFMRVRDLKRQLDKIGHVNLDAVEELEEVDERLTFLQNQRKDLEESRRQLLETIAHLDAESEKRFLETFYEVRDQFRTIFRQLFGGGKAELSLEEGVPILEAGIDIVARPPGRESLPITLLSGGQRTLTALALLFAVFRSRPSPFCVLDEVDAALDDANIGRFLSLVQHAADDTQYIIVTHNKGTMAACRMLYGVTMQTKGVSRVVGVELSEVDEIVPTATGKAAVKSMPVEAQLEDSQEPTVEIIPVPRGGPASTEGAPLAEKEAQRAPESEQQAELVLPAEIASE
ncbi:MAG: chromosome segregation protein [Planctomycetota bacterium]|jgi:chromosome segregation protein